MIEDPDTVRTLFLSPSVSFAFFFLSSSPGKEKEIVGELKVKEKTALNGGVVTVDKSVGERTISVVKRRLLDGVVTCED